jgi:hypothetical protein
MQSLVQQAMGLDAVLDGATLSCWVVGHKMIPWLDRAQATGLDVT